MQIVIDIPDEVYETFGLEYREENCISKHTNDIILDAFCNGIPLPKGHGRLIDVDYLREDFKASKKISFVERMDISCIVDHAPTIIEADTESEDSVETKYFYAGNVVTDIDNKFVYGIVKSEEAKE